MAEYICLSCNTVFSVEERFAKCCGILEEFSPEKHGRLLVGKSNAWISVWKKWSNNPELEKVSKRLYEDGCYGAATHINVFIEELLEKLASE